MLDHFRWCGSHDVDGDGSESCTRTREVGEWDVALVVNDEAPLVWLEHDALIHVDGEGSMTPRDAIKLGWVLIRQGIRGLIARRKSQNFTRSDTKSGSGTPRAIAGAQ